MITVPAVHCPPRHRRLPISVGIDDKSAEIAQVYIYRVNDRLRPKAVQLSDASGR